MVKAGSANIGSAVNRSLVLSLNAGSASIVFVEKLSMSAEVGEVSSLVGLA